MRIDVRDTYASATAEWAPLPEAIYAYIREEADSARVHLKQRRGYRHIDGLKIRCMRAKDDTRVLFSITVKIKNSPGFIYKGVFDIEESKPLAVGDFEKAIISKLDTEVQEDKGMVCSGFDDILSL